MIQYFHKKIVCACCNIILLEAPLFSFSVEHKSAKNWTNWKTETLRYVSIREIIVSLLFISSSIILSKNKNDSYCYKSLSLLRNRLNIRNKKNSRKFINYNANAT